MLTREDYKKIKVGDWLIYSGFDNRDNYHPAKVRVTEIAWMGERPSVNVSGYGNFSQSVTLNDFGKFFIREKNENKDWD